MIEDIQKKLDNLADVLKKRSFDQIAIGTILELKTTLSSAKTPIIPTRLLWDKYTNVVSMVEKILRIASTPGNEYAVHDALRSLRAQLSEFRTMLERAYLIERLQIVMPSVLGLSYALTKLLSDQSFNTIIVAVAITTVVASLYRPLLGILLTGLLGACFILLSTDAGSILTGLLLVAISVLFAYTYMFAKSETFRSKVQTAIGNINRVISTAFMPLSIRIDDIVNELEAKNNYNIEDTGIFRFLDKKELIRYKVVTMVACGRLQCVSFISDSNQSILIDTESKA